MLTKMMTTIGILAATTTMAMADGPLPQEGEKFTAWKETDYWTVYVDAERDSCLMQKVFDGEHVIQIGISEEDVPYLGAFARIPDELIGQEQTQEVTLVVGEEAVISESIKPEHQDETTLYTGAYVDAPSTEYFVANNAVVQELYYEGRTVRLDYALDGVEQANEMLIACNAQFNK